MLRFLQAPLVFFFITAKVPPFPPALLPCRYANRGLDYLFRREHVERVEVVMKETEDCEGRTGFYDAYGVLRDVHQNHLTQMAVRRT